MIIPKDGLPSSTAGDVVAPRHRNRARDFLAERGAGVRHVADFPALLGDHTLLGFLGEGPRATVYRASTAGRSLALKIFDDRCAPDAAILDRFRRQSSAPLRHPSLPVLDDIGILESGKLQGQCYYARHFLRGDSLEDVLEAFELGRSEHPHLSPLAPGITGEPRRGYQWQLAELFAEVAAGLHLVHEAGIYHGRIHPANLIFSPSGTLVLVDFEGHSQRERPSEAFDIGDLRAVYVAPERFGLLAELQKDDHQGNLDSGSDEAADIYSLGAVLYELLSYGSQRDRAQGLQARLEALMEGAPHETFDGTDLLSDCELSVEFADVVRKTLALDPAARYATVAELRDDLRRLTRLEHTVAASERPSRFAAILPESVPETVPEILETAPTLEIHRTGDRSEDRIEDRSQEREVRAALLGAPETGRVYAELRPADEERIEEPVEEPPAEPAEDTAATDAELEVQPETEPLEPSEDNRVTDALVAEVVDGLAAEKLDDFATETVDEVAGEDPEIADQPNEPVQDDSPGAVTVEHTESPSQIPSQGLNVDDPRELDLDLVRPDLTRIADGEDSEIIIEEDPEVTAEPLPARAHVATVSTGVGIEERDFLYEEALPDSNAEWRLHGQKIFASTVAFGVVMISILTWVSATLHSSSETHRQDGVRLGRIGNSITTAFGALLREDSSQVAESLSLASGATRDDERRRALEEIEAHFRVLPKDPLLARLQHPEPFVRIGALEQLRDEIVVRKTRSGDDLVAVTCLLWDDHQGSRCRALEICAEAGMYDAILANFPIGPDAPELTLDRETFATLFDALSAGALAANFGASSAISAFDVRDLDGLDRFFMGVATEAGADEIAGDSDGAPPQTFRLRPNLVIERSARTEESFVDRWLNLHVDLDSAAIVRELDFFETRDASMPMVIVALERTNTRQSRSTLKDLVRSRYLDYGRRSVAALARLGDARALLQLADEDLPLILRLEALERAIPVAGDKELTQIARFLEIHPEPRIRGTVFAGLADRNYFAQNPTALVPALWDPFLRQRGLEHLAIMPPSVAAPSLPTLLDMVRSGDGELRLKVIEILGKTRAPDLLLPLVRQLHESDPALTRKTLEALANLGDDRAIPLAVGLLYPPHRGLMTMVSRLLEMPPEMRREDPALVVLAIQELLEYENSGGENVGLRQIRRGALLSRLGPQFEPQLKELLERIPPRIRNVEVK
jgi:serine/threonine protein kinase